MTDINQTIDDQEPTESSEHPLANIELPELATILIDHQVISLAQAQLAVADQSVGDLSFDEVLVVRGWVNEETIRRLAPGLCEQRSGSIDWSAAKRFHYEHNLAAYRRLMEKMLGVPWDS